MTSGCFTTYHTGLDPHYGDKCRCQKWDPHLSDIYDMYCGHAINRNNPLSKCFIQLCDVAGTVMEFS